MKYTEFFRVIKFILVKNKTTVLFIDFRPKGSIKKYYRGAYYRILRLYNFLIFFKLYRFGSLKNFPNFWKYLRLTSSSKLLCFLKVHHQYTTFFFSYRVRNLFCIIWQGANIETFFSSYLCPSRRSRGNFLPQLKIIRYLIYLYFQDVTSSLKLHFSLFSVKIKYIVKLFFYWLTFYTKLSLTKKTFLLHYITVNNKFPRGRIKKKMYPTKKRYLQRKSNSRVVLK